jgi:von Willebrand factor type A domain
LIASSLTFLTPGWALIALGALAPLAALGLVFRRERRGVRVLALRPSGKRSVVLRGASIVAVAGALGLAASQPVLRSRVSVPVRTDAEAYFVIDISRSMLASRSPGASTRLQRARAAAIAIRDGLPEVSAGVATMTDEVLPDLLPVPDRGAFEQTIRQAVQVDQPPPETDAVNATNLGSLGALGTQNFYSPAAKHRIAIVLTDGESEPFDIAQTARELKHSPGVTPIFVQFWSAKDSVYDPGGARESAYHPDPSSKETLASLAQASNGSSFTEHQLGAAIRAARVALGTGPVRGETIAVTTKALAPYAALAALIPILFLVSAGWGKRLVRQRGEPQSHTAATEGFDVGREASAPAAPDEPVPTLR